MELSSHVHILLQTSEMQWTYNVVGTLPEYIAPQSQASKTEPGVIERSETRNYVLDNLRLKTTAVSSPLKGAPILQRKNRSAAP